MALFRETALGPRPITRVSKKPLVLVLPLVRLTTGSGTWIVPETGTYMVELWGGGGQGGSPYNSYSGTSAHGGAQGGYTRKQFTAKKGDSYSYTVGGYSTFSGPGVSLYAAPGNNGTVWNSSSPAAPPAGGTAGGGDVDIPGIPGVSGDAVDGRAGLYLAGGLKGTVNNNPTAPGASSIPTGTSGGIYGPPVPPVRAGAAGAIALFFIG